MIQLKTRAAKSMARLTIVSALSTGLFLSAALPAFAGNSNGTGQPSQSCGDFLVNGLNNVNGFNTPGFTKAALLYAGSDGTNSLHANNPVAVSQYDVACYQKNAH
jgi:hypothetical protein